MLYYAKITGKKNIEQISRSFLDAGATEDTMILDTDVIQKASGSTYLLLKERLLQSQDSLTIDTLTSLGKNNREISKELVWLHERNIPLLVLDLPALSGKDPLQMDLLSQIYSNLAEIEKNNVKTNQAYGIRKSLDSNNKNYGRPRKDFPINWEDNYKLWKSKSITATEFIHRTGLKKGTFYRMVKDYDAYLKEKSIKQE